MLENNNIEVAPVAADEQHWLFLDGKPLRQVGLAVGRHDYPADSVVRDFLGGAQVATHSMIVVEDDPGWYSVWSTIGGSSYEHY